MGEYYLRNLVGQPLTDDQLADIPRPLAELTIHVTKRFMEGLNLIGSMIVAPIVATARKKPMMQTMVRGGLIGTGIGAILGPMAVYAVCNKFNFDHDPIYDRAYRLRFNRSQVLLDRFQWVIAGTGLIICRLPGFVFGTNIATAACIAYYKATK